MTTVQLDTLNGSASAELFEPSTSGVVGQRGSSEASVVVVHEWWGLNDSIRAICGRLRDEGFAVLAVDLYNGAVTDDPNVAVKLAMDMRTPNSVAIIESAAAFLKQRAQSNGKVGVTGFCLGGAMTLAAASHCPSACAFVPFYGLPLAKYVDWTKTHGPILGHFAEHDRIVDLDRVRAAAADVNRAGGSFELHVYDAHHAFMRSEDPTVFHAEAAALAWRRTLDFLRHHLN
jgi:carboxymethylenebutenolidase